MQVKVDLVKPFLGAALVAESAHQMFISDQFFHQAGQLSASLALHLEHRVGVRRNKTRYKNGQRRQRHHDQCNAPVDEQHHAQRAANRQHAGKQLGKAQQQTIAELLHIGGDAADGIAGAVGIHIFQRQLFQLFKRAHAHIAHHVEGNAVVDHIHQPLGNRRAGDRARHGNGQLGHAAKIHLAGANDKIHGLTRNNRRQQGRHHRHNGQNQRQRDQPGIGTDQFQHAAERTLIHFLLLLAHKVFSTSSLLSWLRQISL